MFTGNSSSNLCLVGSMFIGDGNKWVNSPKLQLDVAPT